MGILDKPEHFVSIQDMPSFDGSTPVLDVYKRLAEAKRGGFILKEGKEQLFVKAGDLAEETMIDSPSDVRNVVADTIGNLCKRAGVGGAIIRVESDPVPDGSDPTLLQREHDDKVYAVIRGGRSIGYFLNHESLLNPATKPPRYVCANGHKNRDPDHGYCYQCPEEIVGIE
jgi:hypothetical protein